MSIMTNMKTYTYETCGNTVDNYGQMGYGIIYNGGGGFNPINPLNPLTPQSVSTNSIGTATQTTQNTIKMAIYLSNQATNQNINYVEADYIGITQEEVNDYMTIHFTNNIKLKVKYVNPIGRYNIVALVKI